jgi:S1-C subfamily serine protease
MTSMKTILTAILCTLVGVLFGFATTTVLHRIDMQAHASERAGNTAGNTGLQDSPASFTPQTGGQSVGVGSNFVSEVYKKVSPAVVHITNTMELNSFWGSRTAEATGSGVIVDERGYILTNNHVVENAQNLVVVLNDGQQFTPKVIGADPGTDLALIKIDAKGKLPFAKMGDSSAIEVGQWVVAIGNPRGLDWTVTVGVISALNRQTVSKSNGQTIRGLIQTDAAINPGNSGGPLLSAQGEVIGINDAIVSSGGGSEGIGLAVPINTAKDVLDDLIKHGRVVRAWLGVNVIEEVTPEAARVYNFPVDYGVIPGGVYKTSPAAAAGVIPPLQGNGNGQYQYDIITAIDDEKIDDAQELLDIIRNHKAGDKITLEIYRITNGEFKVQKLAVTLQALPESAPSMGII